MYEESKFLKIEDFEIFPWNKNFETGYERIDNQHKKLVELINTLARIMVDNKEFEINETFKQLVDYANYHFTDEEEFWVKHLKGTDLYKDHKVEHKSFLPQIEEIKKQNIDGSLSDQIEAIFKFLIRWLAFHIVDSDKRMAIVVKALEEGKDENEARQVSDEKMGGTTSTLIDTLLLMYEGLSLNAIYLLHERRARKQAEKSLIEANIKLEELSITDQLTRLYNRRHFDYVFKKEFLRARRDKNTLTLIEFDVDYFKPYNDNYGHAKGDIALGLVGKTLNEACRRPDDFAFRLGGEEFAVLLIGMDSDKSLKFAEKIRAGVEALNIEHSYNNDNKFLTISGGIISRIPTIDDSLEDFFNAVDLKLYEAKDSGRNRINY